MPHQAKLDDQSIRDLTRLVVMAELNPQKFKGAKGFRAKLRVAVKTAPASEETLASLVQCGDTQALDSYLSHTDIKKVRKLARKWFITRSGTMPDIEILEVLAKHQIKPHVRLFAYRVFEQGFINGDATYAQLAIESFDLPRLRVIAAVPSLTKLVTPSTAGYLEEIIRLAINDKATRADHRLMSIAWGDANPKLMSCLVWLGATPFCEAQSFCPAGDVGNLMKEHAASLSSSHDIIELRHEYPTLTDLLISDLPTTLFEDD